MKINFFATLLVVISALSIGTVQAQNTGDVTLNIKLSPIQTLVVNNAQTIVDLNYTTKADYADGVAVSQADHLTIYCTGGFEVRTKSSSSQLVGTNKEINASDVTITASNGSSALDYATYTPSQLSADEKVIVSSQTGGVDKTINVNYAAKGANEYVDYYHNGENPTVFTTSVTYTIVAK